MNKIEKRGYIFDGNAYTKKLGDYRIKIYETNNELYLRQIIKNGIQTSLDKFNTLNELENDKAYKNVLIDYNRQVEHKRINSGETYLSGAEREKGVQPFNRIDKTPQVKIDKILSNYEKAKIRGEN